MKRNYAFTCFIFTYVTLEYVTGGLADSSKDLHPSVLPLDCLLTVKNETYDLSPLRKWNPWTISFNKNGSLISFELSICDGLASQGANDSCAGGSVCKISNGQRQLVIDSFKSVEFIKKPELDIETLFIQLTGPKCPTNISKNQTVIFILSCGPHLGQPVLQTDGLCRTSFTWTTSVVCLSPLSNQLSEVPCSTYDKAGRFYDLTPLINVRRNHLVETHDGSEFMAISVCSYLANDDATSQCPRNVSSCIKKNGNFFPAGSLTDRLRLKERGNGLRLTYESKITLPSCSGPSKTIVDFTCPSRGKDKTPELVLSSDCLYNINWETEFACPVSVLSSDVSCKLQSNIHGVDIDLSPLQRDIPYNVSGIVNGEDIEFYFNVCGGLGDFNCENKKWRSGTVCMKSSSNSSDPGILYGNYQKLLKYVSGEITLEYPGSVKCAQGQYWKNVIKFDCDSNAPENGSGWPQFVGQEDCVNWFAWKTKYACVKYRSLECQLKSGPLSLVFNPIYRHHSEATWRAIDSLSPVGKSREIYLSLCDGQDLMGAKSPCPKNSSICLLENGTSISLAGKSETPHIKYEYINGTHTYQIEFEGGDPCPLGHSKKSKLILECDESSYSSSPILISETSCQYIFKWKTYAACQHQRLNFQDCKFQDKERGITVDLNPLKASAYYKIEAKEYDFFINICGPVKETNCSKLGMINARGCQVKKDSKQAWNLGEVVIGAAYDDGEMINITYTGGTQYRDPNKTPRSMSITLICDPDAGKGSPVFNGEENRVYSFLWRTSVVCAARESAEECVVYDSLNRKQYDLSRLTKQTRDEDWTLMAADKKFYLNICRPLNKPNGCDKQSAACMTRIEGGKETSERINLGKAVNIPKVTSEGHLQLHYTMGDSCVSFNKETNNSVLISFICNSKALESQGPRFLGILGNCSYSFFWVTEAACPIGKEEFHECTYTDETTGYHFDLNPLHKKDSYYQIKTDDKVFQFNICGPVGGNGCNTSTVEDQISVCEIDKEGKMSRILGYAESGIISQFEGQPGTITYLGYRNGTFPTTTDFEFECDRFATEPQISFEREEAGVIYFRVTTALVCPPKELDCGFVSDENLEYDFSLLARNGGGYWTIRDSQKDRIFYLGLCGAITGVGGPTCHGAGICVGNDTNPYDGSSLGNRIESPKVQDDEIVILYKNGSPCENGFGNKSAIVTLRCSTEEKPPVFVSESDECLYLFELETPSACPLKTFRGNNCRVKDGVYGHVFDLTPLFNKTNDYVAVGEDHVYSLNVCGALSDPPLGCEGAAVCQTKDSDKNFSVNAGQPSSELIYNDGLIQLVYQGGKDNCHKKYQRSTIINFICDHSTEGLDGPHFLSEDHDCTYLFEWPTSWACPPFNDVSCSVQGPDGRTYDLSPLSNPDNNYVVENHLNSREKFLINVCRSIVHKPGNRCPYDASSCLVSTDDSKFIQKSKNLGTLGFETNPSFDNGILKIHYTNGDICRLEGTYKHYMETIVEFRCQETATDSQPELLAFENCQYTFIWFTPFACPIKSTSPQLGGDCSVTNPQTGKVFDFSSLRDKEISVQSSPNHKFALSICQELKDSSCGKGTGSCQMEHAGEQRSFSSGMSNSDLKLLKDGTLSLIYSNGSACHSGHFKRSTIIRFVCDRDRSLGESKVSFVNESTDCTYLFNWHTKLACDDTKLNPKPDVKLACKVETKQGLVDLSAATNEVYVSHSSYQSYGIYFVSLCGEIKNNFLNIPKKASAACVNCSPNDSMSLGQFLDPPFVNDHNIVQMDYKNGSVCPQDPTRKMTSTIFFVCEKLSVSPSFDVIDDGEDECVIYFEFRTPHACPIKPEVCSYGHEDRGFYMELGGFEKVNDSFEVVNDKDKYIISICKPLNISNCTGAGVCLVNERGNQNFGLVKNSNVYHNTIQMTLTYDSDANCSDSVTGKKHTEIKFYCDRSAGVGKPQFYKKYSCRLVFLWATAEVCSDTQPVCTLWTKDQKLYDLRLLSSISHSWNATDDDGNQYWFNMCREVNFGAREESCPPYSSVCIVPPNGTTGLSIGSVLTQKIRIDEVTKEIVLSYDHGNESLCQNLTDTASQHLRSDKKPTSEIRLKCGRNSGLPKLVSKSNCEYKFVWETLIACPELENEPMYENKGLIYDTRLQELGIVINVTSLMQETYFVEETRRKDNFVYVINLGEGVGENISNPICQNALVCQTKSDRSFFRDIGTKGNRRFYLRGSEMKMIVTSNGRKCGKNKSKNVTTIINFQCSRTETLSQPRFKYESGDCDYVFDWETNAVCPFHSDIDFPIHWTGIFRDLKTKDDSPKVAEARNLSIAAIVGIIFAIMIALILAGILVKKERRNAIKSKSRHFFLRMRLPRYQYMQCYFLRLRGENAHSRADGEAVLLSPDDPLPRFHDDSDVDPIA